MDRHFADSDALCRSVRESSGATVLLSFSCGKDSIAAWLRVRPLFERVVPFYLELVPGLEFVEESLSHYERFFGQPIMRLPHPGFARMLRGLVFQPPERCAAIEGVEIPALTYEQIEAHVRRTADAPDAYVAIGTRTADSPIRLANVRKFGSANHRRKSFFAIYDWRIAQLCDCLRDAQVKLPVDYEMFGRSFDGVDYRFLLPIRDRFPRDYARIIEWFPMAELEIARRDFAARRKAAA